MFFFLNKPRRYSPIIPAFTHSSFVLYVLYHSVIQQPQLSSCLPLLPFSQSPSFSLLLCFSILRFLNQYPPYWNLKHYCQWSNPRVSLSVRNLTGRRKETTPRKDTVDSSLRWCEVSLMPLLKSVRSREKERDPQQTAPEHLHCNNM